MHQLDNMTVLLDIMEGKKTRHQQMLEHFVHPEYRRIYQEWHDIGAILNESPVSQQQIDSLFKAIADGAAAGGNVAKAGDAPASNRTFLGKGTDAASKVAAKWEDFKTKIALSGPVSGFDTAFNDIQKDVLKGAGGDQGAIAKALDTYKKFATKYPKTQGAIYAAIAILAGISGWGLGGAAILAGVRTIDRLLQGDKLSSALWKGFKTGAISAAAGAIGSSDAGGGGGVVPDVSTYNVVSGDNLSTIAQDNGISVEELMAANPDITNPDVLRAGQTINIPAESGSAVYDQGVGTASDTAAKVARSEYTPNPAAVGPKRLAETINYKKIRSIWKLQEGMNLPQHSAVYLTPHGVDQIFRNCVKQLMINEGIWDSIKGAAKSGWESATNKITYNKLKLWWQKNYGDQTAEGTVDSQEVATFLKKMGVLDGLIQKTFKDLNIPIAPSITPADAAGDSDAAASGSNAAAGDSNAAASGSDAAASGSDAAVASGSADQTEFTPDQMVELITPATAQLAELWKKISANQGNKIGNPKVRDALKALADQAIDMSNSTGSTSPIKKSNGPGTYAEGRTTTKKNLTTGEKLRKLLK